MDPRQGCARLAVPPASGAIRDVESSGYASLSNDVVERIATLEDVLQIKGHHQQLLQRLKTLEDKIIFIEERFPQIALQYFSYDMDSKSKNFRRVSKLKAADPSSGGGVDLHRDAFNSTKDHFLSLIEKVSPNK